MHELPAALKIIILICQKCRKCIQASYHPSYWHSVCILMKFKAWDNGLVSVAEGGWAYHQSYRINSAIIFYYAATYSCCISKGFHSPSCLSSFPSFEERHEDVYSYFTFKTNQTNKQNKMPCAFIGCNEICTYNRRGMLCAWAHKAHNHVLPLSPPFLSPQ